MKKIYYLSTCSTCTRIIKELNLNSDFIYQDIKTEKISEKQLEEMAEMAGSYQNLFSRRAMKYKELGLKDKKLNEEEFKNYILSEYTFLKRPVLIIDNNIFIGNSKKNVEKAKSILETIKK
nr:ArsC/Spx/MgsR family protein [uncultured Marinifilum sp.]